MSTKTLIAGLLGGIVYFALGFLIWGFLMKETMTSCAGCMRPEAEMNIALGIFANLIYGVFLAWVLSKFPGVNSFSSGLQNGALFMAFLAITLDLGFYVYSTMFTSITCMLIDIVINVVMGGIVGGVIGWWYGRTNGVRP